VDATKTAATPQPFLNTSDNTKARIKEGLIFAETVLQNPKSQALSDRTKMGQIYKEACARLLDMGEEGEVYDEEPEIIDAIRDEWISNMRWFEQEMQYMQCTNTEFLNVRGLDGTITLLANILRIIVGSSLHVAMEASKEGRNDY
jgi:hypothetical protein